MTLPSAPYPTGFELDMERIFIRRASDRIQDLISHLTRRETWNSCLGAGLELPGESHYQEKGPSRRPSVTERTTGSLSTEMKMSSPYPLSYQEFKLQLPNTKALAYPQKNGINESNLLRIVGLFQMDNDAVVTAASPVPAFEHHQPQLQPDPAAAPGLRSH